MGASDPLRIGHVPIGAGHEPVFVAEMSGNHNGDLGRALAIVDAAAAAGVRVLKLQTYTADTITLDVDAPAFRIADEHGLWGGDRLYDLYQQAYTPWEWHEPIFERAHQHGMAAFSAPFDPTAVEFLESLDVPAYKVASNEIRDLPLIRQMAATGKPVIVSTGTATVAEIDDAVRAVRETGNDQLMLTHCRAQYPTDPKIVHLRSIPTMSERWNVPVGLSDHTLGTAVPKAAVYFTGVPLVEKHLTLDAAEGTDSGFSLRPDQVRLLIEDQRALWQARGDAPVAMPDEPGFDPGRLPPQLSGDLTIIQESLGGAEIVRPEGVELGYGRSLYVDKDARAGDRIGDCVRSVRPEGGLHPDDISIVENMSFAADVPAGTPLTQTIIRELKDMAALAPPHLAIAADRPNSAHQQAAGNPAQPGRSTPESGRSA